jgi:hypothetical protein
MMPKPSKFLGNNLTGLCQLLLLIFLPRWVRGSIFSIVLAGVLIYLYLYITIGDYAKQLIKNPPKQKADAAIILAIALI